MKLLKSLLVAAAALAAAQAHAGYTYSFTSVPAGSYTSPSFTDGFQASTQTTSLTDVYLQPQGDTGSFLVVSSQPTGQEGHATINTGGASSYSFVWGSPDTFNSVDIFGSPAGAATTYTGFNLQSQFGLQANGNNAETGLFTITGTGGSVVDHLVLRSQGVAFEVAVAAPVPEPETYAMLLAGLGALGFMAHRRNRAS